MCQGKLNESEEVGKEIFAARKLKIDFSGVYKDLKNLDYSKVIWRHVFRAIVLHILAIYGAYLFLFNCHWKTAVFGFTITIYSGLATTMGTHRLWAHRTYKAKLPLRIITAIGTTMAFQYGIVTWSRIHRLHHKSSETTEDPHNAGRGFFYAHCGFLMYERHPDCVKKMKTIDVSDILADPVAKFQDKYYLPLVALLCYFLPTVIPWYFWNEHLVTGFLVCSVLRHVYVLHCIGFINSLAHWYGDRPYDQSIPPTEHRAISYLTMGEGWHNFHHVFPYDYRDSEFTGKITRNLTANVIEFCHFLGQAYDLRKVDEKVLRERKLRTGQKMSK